MFTESCDIPVKFLTRWLLSRDLSRIYLVLFSKFSCTKKLCCKIIFFVRNQRTKMCLSLCLKLYTPNFVSHNLSGLVNPLNFSLSALIFVVMHSNSAFDSLYSQSYKYLHIFKVSTVLCINITVHKVLAQDLMGWKPKKYILQ